MVKRMIGALVVLAGMAAGPRPAIANADGCATTLLDCYARAATIESFWYRWAAGADCELDFAQCVRIKLLGA